MADNESTSVTKDLGIVSAYGYAKAAGYTGTEEEFEQIFLEFTEDAPGLLDRLDEAVSDCEDAASDAADAKTAAENAQTAAEAAAAAFETDTTLAVSGKAADAKVTGDEITGLKTQTDQNYNDITVIGKNVNNISLPYTVDGTGYIKHGDGGITASTSWGHTDYIPVGMFFEITYKSTRSTSSTPVSGMAFYNSSKTYIAGYSSLKNQESADGYGTNTVPVPANAAFARFTVILNTEAYGEFEAYGKTKLKEDVDVLSNGMQPYADIMGAGYVATTGRRFTVNKNTVAISNADGSTSTSYRCCSILGTLKTYSDAWSNIDLSNATYFPINYDPTKLQLYITIKWDKLNSTAKNYFNVATKNESTGVVTKYNLSGDVNTSPKIRKYNFSGYCPLISENKNFALFVENRNAQVDNLITYWFSLEPIDNEFHEVDTTLNNKVNDYASLLVSKNSVESFMFFTDSHYVGASKWKEYFLLPPYKQMGAVFNTAPVDFCIFGGDAIVNTSAANTITPAQAVSYLSYHDKVCRTIFGNDTYFPMVGNHDLNPEGTASITTQDLINAEFRKWNKAYYKFNGNTSTIYVLDTGMNRIGGNYSVPMDSYKWEQIDWLGKALAEDDPDHAIITMHIIRNNNTNQPKFQMFIEANELCEAYNDHTTITKNSITYDFTNCTGRVELFLGGHLHSDSYDIFENGIPCIMRANLQNGSVVPTYDLVLCDWTGRAVTFFRIGNGNSKTVNLDTGEEIT